MYTDMFSLKGKVALVTGASRGIGEAIALGFAEVGAKVVLASRKQEALEEVRKKIEEKGGNALVVPTHMGHLDEVESLVGACLSEYGTIDVLVNNAATNPYFGLITGVDEGIYDKIMEVNVKGPFFLTRLVGEGMNERGSGSIINISSEAGTMPSPMLGVYSVSKAGVDMLTKVFAQEWGQHGVRVNSIAPGLVKTHFSRTLWSNDEILNIVLKGIPMGRIGMPEDIVGCAIFLASDASGYLTGQVIMIDGGRAVHGV